MVRAAGHCPCSAPLSGMPLGIVIVGVCCRCRRCTMHCCYHTAPAVVVAPCLLAVPLAVIAHHRCRHHLAAPRAVVHHRCTVMPLSRCWIRHCRLPPSSLLRHLRHRAVGHRRHCHTVFALPGLPPSPLGVAMPCTHLAAPLCPPAASICIVTPLCAAVVVVHGARALHGWCKVDVIYAHLFVFVFFT